MAKFNTLDLVKGQRGKGVAIAFDLKGVSIGCSIMSGTLIKLPRPPKQ